MKGKIMYNVISILFAFFLIAMHPLAIGVENIAETGIHAAKIKPNKVCYDTNFLKALKESPPNEYKRMSAYTNEILTNSPEDYVILEILTDNMVSYTTLLFTDSEKKLPKTKYDGNRIHVITLNAKDFAILKFLERGIEKFSVSETINVYTMLDSSSPSPTRYLLLKTPEKTTSILGIELLSNEVLCRLKKQKEFGNLYFWHLFISYLKTTNEYEVLKSCGL